MAVVLKLVADGGVHRVRLEAAPTYDSLDSLLRDLWPGAGESGGCGLARYTDEEGDMCLLTRATFADFLETAKATCGGGVCPILRLEVLVPPSSSKDGPAREKAPHHRGEEAKAASRSTSPEASWLCLDAARDRSPSEDGSWVRAGASGCGSPRPEGDHGDEVSWATLRSQSGSPKRAVGEESGPSEASFWPPFFDEASFEPLALRLAELHRDDWESSATPRSWASEPAGEAACEAACAESPAAAAAPPAEAGSGWDALKAHFEEELAKAVPLLVEADSAAPGALKASLEEDLAKAVPLLMEEESAAAGAPKAPVEDEEEEERLLEAQPPSEEEQPREEKQPREEPAGGDSPFKKTFHEELKALSLLHDRELKVCIWGKEECEAIEAELSAWDEVMKSKDQASDDSVSSSPLHAEGPQPVVDEVATEVAYVALEDADEEDSDDGSASEVSASDVGQGDSSSSSSSSESGSSKASSSSDESCSSSGESSDEISEASDDECPVAAKKEERANLLSVEASDDGGPAAARAEEADLLDLEEVVFTLERRPAREVAEAPTAMPWEMEWQASLLEAAAACPVEVADEEEGPSAAASPTGFAAGAAPQNPWLDLEAGLGALQAEAEMRSAAAPLGGAVAPPAAEDVPAVDLAFEPPPPLAGLRRRRQGAASSEEAGVPGQTPPLPRWAAEIDGAALEAGANKVVHMGHICDGCEACPLPGPRFTCKVCGNFDLCWTCYMQKDHIRHPHDPTHRFQQVLWSPGVVPSCPGGCGFGVTKRSGHPTHCCPCCVESPGQHSDACMAANAHDDELDP